MDAAAQWSQHQVANLGGPMEEITSSPTPLSNINHSKSGTPVLERRARPQKEQNLNCPRCNSTNTKFCYYNNYSLTQPRYFCKTCRRYWTQGGSLRNVPVGGGSRKNKRSSSGVVAAAAATMLTSTPPPSSTTTGSTPSMNNKLIPDINPPSSLTHLLTAASQNPNIKFLEGQDLNLAFPMQGMFGHNMDRHHHHHHHHQLPKMEGFNTTNNENHEPPSININCNVSSTTTATSCTTTTTSCGGNSGTLSALELLRTGIASKGGLNPYLPMTMPDSNTLYPSGFPNLQELKPGMNFFSSPGDQSHSNQNNVNNMVGSRDNNNDNVGTGGGARLLFPFADMNKLASSTTANHHEIDHQNKGGNDHHQHHHQGQNPGYWSGMLGGGTW